MTMPAPSSGQVTQTGATGRKTKALISGISYGASALYALQAPNVNYDIFQIQNKYAENEATAIEVQAQQQANAIRERFTEAVGNYKYAAASRGVKVGEGSVAQNIEMSAKELGGDISRIQKSAEIKARSRREVGEIRKRGAKKLAGIERELRYAGLASKIGGAVSSFGEFSQYR